MKRCILFLSLFLCINSIAQEENRVVMTKLIVYKVLNESFTSEQNTEAVKLFNILTDTNVIYHYDCYEENPLIANKYKYDNIANIPKLTKDEIDYSFWSCDSTTIQILFPPYNYYDTVCCSSLKYGNFSSLSFSETWEYNTIGFQFYKKVKSLSPIVEVCREFKYLKGRKYISLPQAKQLEEGESVEICKDELFLSVILKNKFKNANWSMKNVQYDVFVSEPVEDLLTDYEFEITKNVEESDRYDFMEYVFSSIDNNSINAYMDSNKTIEINSTNDIVLGYDTITVYKNYPPYEKDDTIIANIMTIEDVAAFHFVEDWYFDIEKQSFIKKVKAIGFMIEEFDYKTFESNGYKPLFWVFFD